MKRSTKTFLKFPEYPGGKEAMKKYFRENLKYPKEALENGIEGTVYVIIEINDNGEVINAKVLKGLGFGCDEEAIRLVKNLEFGSVRNRKVRVKTKRKLSVRFNLPKKPQVKFNYVGKKNEPQQTGNSQKAGYTYTIQLKQ